MERGYFAERDGKDLNIQKVRPLTHFIVLVIAVLSLNVILASAVNAASNVNLNAARFENEATSLNADLYRNFYDRSANMFRSIHEGPIADTVSSDAIHNNGFVFWPTVLAFYALVEGEKALPGAYRSQIQQLFNFTLQQYYSYDPPRRVGYAAWIDPDMRNSDDLYYDDNALAVIALCDAYTATLNQAYKDRASQIMQFIYKGRDYSGNPGGLRWGFDRTKPGRSDRTASANTLAAIAAFKLAAIGVQYDRNVAWGKSVLDWVSQNLMPATQKRSQNPILEKKKRVSSQLNDYLVRDALYCDEVLMINNVYSCPPNAAWHVRDVAWTYNSGNQLLGRVLLYQLRLIPLSQVDQYLGLAGGIRNGAAFDFFGRS
jgi:hypothetical protein